MRSYFLNFKLLINFLFLIFFRLNFIFYGISCENYRRELFKMFSFFTGKQSEKNNTYLTVNSQAVTKFGKTRMSMVTTKVAESKV